MAKLRDALTMQGMAMHYKMGQSYKRKFCNQVILFLLELTSFNGTKERSTTAFWKVTFLFVLWHWGLNSGPTP
jgi:hypothetical protein